MLLEVEPVSVLELDESAASMSQVQPFLRWAGGKRQLVPALLSHLPESISSMVYIEPFLGAGSLYFAVQPLKAILGDANRSLIHTYKAIRDTPSEVRAELQKLINRHSHEHYYLVREAYNRGRESAIQAARFIYLNKTCFNGIFRVNTRGAFNVPKGGKDKLTLPTELEYSLVSELLERAELHGTDYAQTLSLANTGCFVYLDPPYPPLNETAYFTHYTSDRFGTESQMSLASEVKKLHNRGVFFLMSNADTPLIRDLYSEFTLEAIPVQRYVSCKGQRIKVSELLIRNY